MLQISFIRAEKDAVIAGLQKRNFSDEQLRMVDEILETDDLRRKYQKLLDDLREENNKASRAIGVLYKSGQKAEADDMRAQVAEGKEKIKEAEENLKNAGEKLENLLLEIPNIPHASVPKGSSENDNEVYQPWETALPELPDSALPHWELAKKYAIFDLELGTKIAGSGFPLYRGKGARLQRALINFFLDEAMNAGYEEILPPLLVNEDTARATGQLPDKEGQMYFVEKDNLYLIPTAEVPVTNIYRDVILQESDFPIKLTGYTPCFRREAGSYGAHVRGLNRVHQFDKVEIVRMEHPDRSYQALHEMLDHVRGLLTKLGLPYRILRLCGGDMSFASALTFDFEVFSAAQKKWLEVSSVSNFETFQSNRMKLRFKNEEGKTQLAHTLNGSALALARIVAALLENNQEEDGIRVPPVLVPYTGFDKIN